MHVDRWPLSPFINLTHKTRDESSFVYVVRRNVADETTGFFFSLEKSETHLVSQSGKEKGVTEFRTLKVPFAFTAGDNCEGGEGLQSHSTNRRTSPTDIGRSPSHTCQNPTERHKIDIGPQSKTQTYRLESGDGTITACGRVRYHGFTFLFLPLFEV